MAEGSLGRGELLLVAATAAATLATQQLCVRCARWPSESSPPPAASSTLQLLQQLPAQEELRPPFPLEVVALLRSCALCYLSTVAGGCAAPPPNLKLRSATD